MIWDTAYLRFHDRSTKHTRFIHQKARFTPGYKSSKSSVRLLQQDNVFPTMIQYCLKHDLHTKTWITSSCTIDTNSMFSHENVSLAYSTTSPALNTDAPMYSSKQENDVPTLMLRPRWCLKRR